MQLSAQFPNGSLHEFYRLKALISLEQVNTSVPWVPKVFLACGGNFRCWPKAEATSGEAKDLTETGNRARKVSGTQGNTSVVEKKKRRMVISKTSMVRLTDRVL